MSVARAATAGAASCEIPYAEGYLSVFSQRVTRLLASCSFSFLGNLPAVELSTTDAPALCCAFADERRIVAGDQGGRAYIPSLEERPCDEGYRG
jgi:hypothetical protein